MKKIIFIISSLVLLYSCTQPLILKNTFIDDKSVLSFGLNERRIFYQPESISDSLQWLWTAVTNGSQPNTSLLIVDEYLIAADLSGRIYAYDKENGKAVGYEKYTGAISVAPVVNSLRLFFIVNEKNQFYSRLIMFDYLNNKILAEDRINGSVTNEMIRLEDGIIVLTDRGELIKYNYAAQREYSVRINESVLSNPAANDNFIALGTMKGELILINRNDGTIIFREKGSSPIEGGFTFDGDVIYFGDSQGYIYSFDTKARKVNWKYGTGARIVSTPVFDDEKVIVGNLSGKLYSLNKETGKKIWIYDTNGSINTTPLLTKTVLIQPDANKKVHLISSSLGLVFKTLEFERRVKLTPLLRDGILYLGSDRGNIHAYRTFSFN